MSESSTHHIVAHTELTDPEKAQAILRLKSIARFVQVKAQMMSEAVDELRELGYSTDSMSVRQGSTRWHEVLCIDAEPVYQVEAMGETTETGAMLVKEVRGTWVKRPLAKLSLITSAA